MYTKAMEYSLESRRKSQAEHAERVFPYIEFYRKQGYGWKMTARLLDLGGIPAPRGGNWHANQVRRIYNLMAGRSRTLSSSGVESATGAVAVGRWG